MTDFDIECCLSIAERNFTRSVPSRFISGVVISSDRPNSHGVSFLARGLTDLKLPVPLLIAHDPIRSVGKVIQVKTIGDKILFKAELCNDDYGFYLVRPVWAAITAKQLTYCSVGSSGQLGRVSEAGKISCWNLTEISLTDSPADGGAVIERAWEKTNVVYCDRPSEILHWERH